MKVFKLFGTLLDYPDYDLLAELRAALGEAGAARLVASADEAEIMDATERATLAGFIERMAVRDTLELQGDYVREFDMTAEHTAAVWPE